MDVLIVEPIDAQVLQWLHQRHAVHFAPELAREPRALRHALYNVRALIAPPSLPLDASLLHQAPALRAVGVVGHGVEMIDTTACQRMGVEVVRAAAASAPAEAEFVIGALLSLLRRVPVVTEDGAQVGRELGGVTVGLVGLGAATPALVPLLGAFGSRVVGYDPAVHATDALWSRWGVLPLPLRELIELSDAVCVMLPYFTRYRGLLGERVLPYAKPDQVLVSLSRSSLFDEASLADALHSGRMAAAWLDSVEPGTLEPGRPLYGIETLQVTPRLAGITRESRRRSAWTVARRIDELLGEQPPAPPGFRPTVPSAPLDLADDSASA
ncbi:phosphoglycerate dehydrogenase [Calidifontimicrobium sp. SYSU G02091]|uniref:NAD(P)-dependent oxidoreductase n=1 Tax=Calidifontimicrobium sp. SYSU G02091 TaxID=2926421 RepID=UPI001F52CE5C|nr:NAD(P)-dependent oxidoreductase [Calidifontimicrobium sp. SYSU G02091]MCI1192720.1 phosphoglycerate dehydrogenase [Calidifontimicrobium sp. SYSU G02091]